MAYDEGLAQRLRDALADGPPTVEKRMFGGMGLMVQGHLCCGVQGDDLIVRVGPDRYADAVGQPHARVFDFTGRPMAGWVVVAPAGIATDEALAAWVRQGLDFALSLPPKEATVAHRKRGRTSRS